MLTISKDSGDSDGEELASMKTILSELPATDSLPTYTESPTKPIIKKPKENLSTVLKDSAAAIRKVKQKNLINGQRSNKIEKPQGHVLDNFLDSLKPKKKNDALNSSIAALLPKSVLRKTPRLSRDNCEGFIEIKECAKEKRQRKIKEARNIIPKIKKPSISLLNQDLDRKIKDQQKSVLESRKSKKQTLKAVQEEEEQDFGYTDVSESDAGDPHTFQNADINSIIDPASIHVSIEGGAQPVFDDEIKNIEKSKKIIPKIMEDSDLDNDSSESCNGSDHSEDDLDLLMNHKSDTDGGESGERMELFEEEAEDEESGVSNDEVDEKEIEEELRESKFVKVNSSESDGENNHTEIHRQFRDQFDDEETEMIMNRFVPDEVLRETGTFAQMKRKYAALAEFEEHQGVSMKEKRSLDKDSQPTSSQSHPDFLKLLEMDRLSESELDHESHMVSSHPNTDFENDDDQLTQSEYEEELEQAEKENLESFNSLFAAPVNMAISRKVPKQAQMGSDDLLKKRLMSTDTFDLSNAGPLVSNQTFATISNRPDLPDPKNKKRK